MRPAPASSLRLSAAALLAAAAGLRAQCIWSHHDSIVGTGNIAVYDSLRQRVLYVCTSTYCGSTTISTWDGSHWTQIATNGPAPRSGAAAAYDAARDRVVLFGGARETSPYTAFADTWEWDGSAWTQATTPTSPAARSNHSMVYDASRQRTVLFGGGGPGPTWVTYGDTWEWNGTSWVQLATTGPAHRSGAYLAYDSSRQLSLLYGGYTDPGLASDLWEWNGAVWNQRSTAGPFNQATSAVFDSARNRLIVGRGLSTASPGQTWEVDPVTAQWTLRDPGSSGDSPAAFDQARSRVVYLTSEYDGAGSINDPVISYPQASYPVIVNGDVTIHVITIAGSPSFRWFRDGQPLTNGGQFSGVDTDTLAIHTLTFTNSGTYSVEASNPCWTFTRETHLTVHDCYANCDQSTAPPVLNANDFQCFLNRFAAGDLWANCDGANPPPQLGANDFQCFLNFFAAGCP